jgi:hypothetical protein
MFVEEEETPKHKIEETDQRFGLLARRQNYRSIDPCGVGGVT